MIRRALLQSNTCCVNGKRVTPDQPQVGSHVYLRIATYEESGSYAE